MATNCGFELWAHERVARQVGLDDAELDGIRSGTFADDAAVDPGEAMVFDLARRLAGRRPLDDEAYLAAVAVLGERGLLELVVLVGYYAMLGQLMEVFGVGVPDDASGAPGS